MGQGSDAPPDQLIFFLDLRTATFAQQNLRWWDL